MTQQELNSIVRDSLRRWAAEDDNRSVVFQGSTVHIVEDDELVASINGYAMNDHGNMFENAVDAQPYP